MKQKTQENKGLKSEKTETLEQINQQKSGILKPLVFFLVFVACIAGASLYPYVKQKKQKTDIFKNQTATVSNSVLFTKAAQTSIYPKEEVSEEPILNEDKNDLLLVQEEEQPKEEKQNTEEDSTPKENSSYTSKDKLILSQTKTIEELNEKIHRLEIENLNLIEKTTNEGTQIILINHLIDELRSGKPFKITLDTLLIHNKTNVLALNVKNKLGDYASEGLPSPESLKTDFLEKMDLAKKSYYIHHRNASWNEKWTGYFKSMVYIYPQKMDPKTTDGVDLIFLAKEQVLKNNFAQALQSVEKLPHTPRSFFNIFIKNTKKYLEAQEIIDTYLNK